MGRIPQSFINDLLDRVDIVDVIERRMTIKKAGKNYSGLCPFHDEKTPSFTVSPDKQFFHCFGCQENGTALSFIMKFDRLEFVEAVEALAQHAGVEVPREKSVGGGRRVDQDLYQVMAKAERFFRQALRDSPAAVSYLKQRGLTGEVARDFGIGVAPPGWQNLRDGLTGVTDQQLKAAGLVSESDKGRLYDKFRDRIMFPIRDTRGRVIAFGGRVFGSGDDGPKYLNSPETELFAKGKELYGLYEARRAVRSLQRLLIVEGYMDVVALAQHGIPYAVATLGTASGTQHFEKVFRYADEVVCCFDGDNAGRQAAWKALENALPTLNEHRQLKLMFLPDGEDPDSLVRSRGKAAFQELLDNADSGLEFLQRRLAQGLDLETLDGKARYAGLLQPYIDQVPVGLLRDMLNQRLATITGLQQRIAAVQPATPEPSVRHEPVAQRKLDKRSKHLLGMLLRHPHLWHKVPDEVRQGVLKVTDTADSVGELLHYLEANPAADAEELLVLFGDNPLIQQLVQQPDLLPNAELPLAVQSACEELIRTRNMQQRKNTLEAMGPSNVEQLRKYWQQRTGPDTEDYSE